MHVISVYSGNAIFLMNRKAHYGYTFSFVNIQLKLFNKSLLNKYHMQTCIVHLKNPLHYSEYVCSVGGYGVLVLVRVLIWFQYPYRLSIQNIYAHMHRLLITKAYLLLCGEVGGGYLRHGSQ